MQTRGLRKDAQVVDVRGDDVVTIDGQADDRRLDSVRRAGTPEEHSRTPTEHGVDRHDVHPGE